MAMMVQELTLPIGFQDSRGRLHRQVQMRLATARDEIEPLADPRVKENEAFLGLLLLSRVVLRLGEISPVTPEVIGSLYAADFSYLQDCYSALNSPGQEGPRVNDQTDQRPSPLPTVIHTQCPNCQAELTLDLSTQE